MCISMEASIHKGQFKIARNECEKNGVPQAEYVH
jgi:hypothetical protein